MNHCRDRSGPSCPLFTTSCSSLALYLSCLLPSGTHWHGEWPVVIRICTEHPLYHLIGGGCTSLNPLIIQGNGFWMLSRNPIIVNFRRLSIPSTVVVVSGGSWIFNTKKYCCLSLDRCLEWLKTLVICRWGRWIIVEQVKGTIIFTTHSGLIISMIKWFYTIKESSSTLTEVIIDNY